MSLILPVNPLRCPTFEQQTPEKKPHGGTPNALPGFELTTGLLQASAGLFAGKPYGVVAW